ncbi:MAG: exodeoxyribonuclease VII large subunit, partial [Acetomicrobium flavidum]|nr:exodeoxyribonuclease VII large subunit [Acetomicrobium flavidum]
RIIAEAKERLAHAAASLDALSPLKSISRGWITCLSEEEEIVTSLSQIDIGDKVFLCMVDGRAQAEIKSLHPKGE